MPESPEVAIAPKSKKLAVFLDGTWNAMADNTNVWRMKSLCATASSEGARHGARFIPHHAQPIHFVPPGPQGMFSGRTYQSLEVAFLCRGKGLNWLARKISENP